MGAIIILNLFIGKSRYTLCSCRVKYGIRGFILGMRKYEQQNCDRHAPRTVVCTNVYLTDYFICLFNFINFDAFYRSEFAYIIWEENIIIIFYQYHVLISKYKLFHSALKTKSWHSYKNGIHNSSKTRSLQMTNHKKAGAQFTSPSYQSFR